LDFNHTKNPVNKVIHVALQTLVSLILVANEDKVRCKEDIVWKYVLKFIHSGIDAFFHTVFQTIVVSSPRL